MLARDVGPDRARDPAHVDPAMLVEALVLDGDDRLQHDRIDLIGAHEDAALRSAQRGQNRVVVVRVDVAVDLVVDARRIARRDLARDRRHHAERERGEAEEEENEEKQEKPERAKEVLSFFDWAYRNGGQMAEQLDYVPMPAKLISMVEESWKQITGPDSKPVWNGSGS